MKQSSYEFEDITMDYKNYTHRNCVPGYIEHFGLVAERPGLQITMQKFVASDLDLMQNHISFRSGITWWTLQ